MASAVALLTIALAVPLAAQRATQARTASALDWPAITRDAKPWTRWWWLGSAVDKVNLTEQLGQLAAAGFGGVEVTVIYGAKGADSLYIPYLSPKWVEMISHTASEAHRLGMGLDLPQGSGWRMGGPSVSPADANASLVLTLDSVRGTWRAGTRFSGDNVKRPAPGGEGPAIDPFSQTATAHYLSMFAEKTASLPKGAIRSYFHDSFEYTGDGSSGLFDFFKSRRGYDLADELPALAGRADSDRVARVQSDYRQTLDEMLLEHFVRKLTSWSHGRGALMREQAHGSPANILDLYAAADIPETEIFGVLGSPDADPLINMFASSAAHVAGKRLASAESFTWLGEHFSGTLDEMKQAADRMFLAGINHLVYHGTAYSPSQAAWPGWQFYASMEFNPRNAFWRDLPAFNQYVTRVQSVLQSGRADNDILLYWPIWDNWHDVSRRRMDFRVHDPVWFHNKPFGQAARTLHEAGYGMDYVSDRQLETDISATGGRVRGKGGEWSVIVVPNAVHMPPSTMRRLLELARGGATVAFIGALPGDVPGLARLAKRRAELANMQQSLAWKAGDRGVRHARVGRGRVLSGERLDALLDAAGVKRDPLADEKGLRFLRRQGREGAEYFIVATDSIARFVRLAANPAAVALLDPMTGRSGLATMSGPKEEFRSGGQGKAALLILARGQSVILRQLRRRPVDAATFQYEELSRGRIALRGPWSVVFVHGGPVLPQTFTSDTVTAWTSRGDADADRFAGTARYTIQFDAPDTLPRHLLSLGRVAESARVKLNGRELGVVFANPFSIETGPLRSAGNVLEIEVTNVSANRIRDLDRRKVEWRIFRDINFVGIDYKPFDASNWPIRPSGLLGPVTIRPIVREMINAVQ